MIDQQFLQNYAKKAETSFDNILREYLQHLYLRNFYTKSDSRNFLFKGGTALKLVFGSPRFSEDLDFTGVKNSTSYEEVLQDCLLELSSEGVKFELVESKPTSGGHIAIIKFNLFGESIQIQNQISFRKSGEVNSENIVIISGFTPSYNAYILERSIIVGEKVNALLERAKPRDFFDLYYILRNKELRQQLHLDEGQREKIFANLQRQRKEELAGELKRLLPRSFWPVVADLPLALKRELV